MEKLFYVGSADNFTNGIFGNATEVCQWILNAEGHQGKLDDELPFESLQEFLSPAIEAKYRMVTAEEALSSLVTVEEAVRHTLRNPDEAADGDIGDWLELGIHTAHELEKMAHILDGRTSQVRYRGEFHTQGLSPFRAGQLDQLLAQISA